jgi:uncharacterized protein YycO
LNKLLNKLNHIIKNRNIQILSITILILIIFTSIYPKSNVLSTPSFLEKGDLLFCDYNSDFISKLEKYNIKYHHPYSRYGYSNDHVAMYIGNNMFVESCPYYWDKEEETWIGVVTTHYGLLNLWGENISFGLINNITTEQRKKAVESAIECLGNSYSYLSCGELISQSYKNQNIDLYPDKYFVTPYNLKQSKYIQIIETKNDSYWYPFMYFKWYVISLFDYVENISDSQLLKDLFIIFQSIIT